MERKLYRLRPMQRWLIDTHFEKAKSTMMNIAFCFRLDPLIDVERLAKAINDTLEHHDIFKCRLAIDLETGDICQRFDGAISPTVFERMNTEQFELRKEQLRAPYNLIGTPLYRIHILEVDDQNYLYVDFYHAMMDGVSVSFLFLHELAMRYRGGLRTFQNPAPSYAERIIAEQNISDAELETSRNYWRRMLDGFDEDKHLPPADIHSREAWAQNTIDIDMQNVTTDYFKSAVIKENTFFIAATMLSVAKLTGSDDAIISWVHNGRLNRRDMKLFGLMIEQLPIKFDFKRDITVSEYLAALDAELATGLTHMPGLDVIYSEGLEDYCVSFIMQGKIHKTTYIIDDKPVEVVDVPQNDYSAVENAIDVEMNVNDDGSYTLVLDYDASRYSERAMKNFAATFDEIILALKDGGRMLSTILHGEGSQS